MAGADDHPVGGGVRRGVIGVGFMTLLSSLWLAIARQSGVSFFAQTLSWWIGGTAVAALFVAGVLAGWLAGCVVPGPAGWTG